MSESVRITVLVENSVQRPGLVAEHGLCLHIQIGSRRLLFDTGQTDLALGNAETLHLSLDRLEAIVLSHGHYDHTGGLAAVCRQSPAARIFLNRAAMGPKFGVNPDGSARYIGMPEEAKQSLADAGKKLVLTPACREVVEGLFVTGEIPRQTNFEDVGGKFFLDERCQQPDPLVDDQALFLETSKGVVVLLGCAHAGIVNTLDHVQHLTGGKPVTAVIGGLHLGSAREERIRQTIARLRAEKLECLAPLHCTGWPATLQLWHAFPDTCRPAGVGTVFEFKLDQAWRSTICLARPYEPRLNTFP